MGQDPDSLWGGSESGLLRDQAESWSGTGRRSYQSRGAKQGRVARTHARVETRKSNKHITPKSEDKTTTRRGASKQNWVAKDNKQKGK